MSFYTRKRLEKIAITGPLIEVGNLGLPSAVGYAMGSGHDFVDEEDAEDYLDSGYNPAGGLFVPGYTGYRAGKKKKARKYLRSKRREKKAASYVEKTAAVNTFEQLAPLGYFGSDVEAAVAGIKEAQEEANLLYYTKEASDPWNSEHSELYVDPKESRQKRLDTLLRRY